MFCSTCGAENMDTASFCASCGARISRAGASTLDPGSERPETTARAANYAERFTAAVADRYTDLREIGRGGMAVVFVAHDTRLDRTVALKLLPEEFQHDAGFRERFIREAKIAAKLTHPNIIQIHDVEESGEFTYFAMAYIEGLSLAQIIRSSGALPIKLIARFGIQICFALQDAHNHDVIHRDIKPENILVDKKKMPIVVDFGIAKALSESRLSQTGMLIGTPHYMSPEQIKTGRVDGRSDIYSLGCLLYEMATGHPPFHGLDPTAIMYHHVNEYPKPPHDLNPAISPVLSALIMKSLAKRPEDRFQSAAELGRELHNSVYAPGPSTPEPDVASALPSQNDIAPTVVRTAPANEPDHQPATLVTAGMGVATPNPTKPAERSGAMGDTIVASPRPVALSEPSETGRRKNTSSGWLVPLLAVTGLTAAGVIAGVLLLGRDKIPPKPAVPPAERTVPAPIPGKASATNGRDRAPEPSQPEQTGPDRTAYPSKASTPPQSKAVTPTGTQPAVPTAAAPVTGTARGGEPVAGSTPTRQATPPPVQQPARGQTAAPQSGATSQTPTTTAARPTPPVPTPQTPAPAPADRGQSAQPSASQQAAASRPEAPTSKAEPVPPATIQRASLAWVTIPGGTFLMGDVRGELAAQFQATPVHRVTVRGFSITRDEVTVQQYAAFLVATGHEAPTQWSEQQSHPQYPVVFVSWQDARDFATWAGGRLPTEAEWEYASRGGIEGKRYSWGDEEPAGRAVFGGAWADGAGWIKALRPVGSYASNGFGMNDMAGSVWEWCQDWFGPYSAGDTSNPPGPPSSTQGRVVRGGAWNSAGGQITAAIRGGIAPSEKRSNIGFRIAR